jgi:hypothetical protein
MGFLDVGCRVTSSPVNREAAVGALWRRRHLRTMRTDQLSKRRVRISGAGVALGGAATAPRRLAREVPTERGGPAVDNGAMMVIGRRGGKTMKESPQHVPARRRPRLPPAR